MHNKVLIVIADLVREVFESECCLSICLILKYCICN